MTYVPQDRLEQFCRFYADDSTVRSMVKYEFGVAVSQSRIARARKKACFRRIAKPDVERANGTDKPHEFATGIRRAVEMLAVAIEREHPGHYAR